MRIIDAHLHFVNDFYFDRIAAAAGHENSAEHLREQYELQDIVHGIVMGNRGPEPGHHAYPEFLSYCVGIERMAEAVRDMERQVALVEENLQRRECVGIKLYPGYDRFYIYDERLAPIYALAEKYDKPVAVHTGLTASSDAILKYSHPLILDEAAARWTKVQFVMCHIGNPWLADAVAVMEKNPNVAVDLSGLLERKIPDMALFLQKKKGYVRMLNDWLEYLDCYDRVMFGTDWPLANLGDYIAFTKAFVPEAEWSKVFFASAAQIYQPQLPG